MLGDGGVWRGAAHTHSSFVLLESVSEHYVRSVYVQMGHYPRKGKRHRRVNAKYNQLLAIFKK